MICLIQGGSIECLTGTVASGFTEDKSKTSIMSGCTQGFNSFTFGKFHKEFAVVCTLTGEIKIQRLTDNLILKSPLIKLTKLGSIFLKPSLVYFTNEKTGLFYSINTSNSACSIFIIPQCINTYTISISKSQIAILEMINVFQDVTDQTPKIQFTTIPNNGELKKNDNTLIQTNTDYTLDDLENMKYQSSIIQTEVVSIKLLTEENFESDECSITINVKNCYASCYSCTIESTNSTDHKCNGCTDNYYNKETNMNNENCYNADTVGIGYIFKGNVFNKCYESCSECTAILSDITNHKCSQCKDNYYNKEENLRQF